MHGGAEFDTYTEHAIGIAGSIIGAYVAKATALLRYTCH